MKKKSLLLAIMVVGIATLFISGSLIAANDFPENIEMKTEAYEKHTKGIAEFSHGKHVDEYDIGCGECHHDDKGKPLTDLKKGDDVQKCIDCHSKPGQKPKGKDAPKLTEKEELEYHAEAVHDNCVTCHRAYNKENKTKAAPTSCTKCHPKTDK